MRNKTMLTFILVFVVFLFAYAAHAEIIHISKKLDGRIMINADITVAENDIYSIYDFDIPDLTKSDTLNERVLADLFFKTAMSERQYIDEREDDINGRWGYCAVVNEPNEMIYAYQGGLIRYQSPYYERYCDVISIATYNKNYDLSNISGARDIDLPYMTMQQAITQCAELISPLSTPLTSVITDAASYDHVFIGNMYTDIFEKNDSMKDKLRDGTISPIHDWSEIDDVYAFTFEYHLDGIPVNKDYMESVKNLSYMRDRVASPSRIEAQMNSLGLCYLYMDVIHVGEALETRTVISHEEALTRLEQYFDEIIAPYPIEIIKGYLMYVPIFDGQDYFQGKLIPAWCFESVCIPEGETRDYRTYAFNAFTGEELQ